MKRFILTEEQLKKYINRKKDEKVFYNIIEKLHANNKNLNENVSCKKANQTVIDNYNRKNLITPKVAEMLIKFNIINENNEII